MSEHKPPAAVHLLWCPACGHDNRYGAMARDGRHYAAGKRCPGTPQELTYMLPVTPEPPPAAEDGTYRAAVAVEVAVRPGLRHIDAHSLTFVGRTVVFGANNVEQLATLSGVVLRNIADVIPDSVAAHPRPAPDGWTEGLHAPREWRHGYRG